MTHQQKRPTREEVRNDRAKHENGRVKNWIAQANRLRERLRDVTTRRVQQLQTVAELEARTGINRATLDKWMGRTGGWMDRKDGMPSVPDLEQVIQLANEARVGLDFLLGRDGAREAWEPARDGETLAVTLRKHVAEALERDGVREQAFVLLPEAEQLREDVIRAYSQAVRTLDEREVRTARMGLRSALLHRWCERGQELFPEQKDALWGMIVELETAAPSEPVRSTYWPYASTLAEWAGPIFPQFRVRPGNSAHHEHDPALVPKVNYTRE